MRTISAGRWILPVTPFYLYGLTMPTGHRRPPPYLLAEEVHSPPCAKTVSRSSSAAARHLADRTADMPDIVRAKLHKITGYVLRGCRSTPDALAHLQRAIQLDTAIGVKKDIEQLERQLKAKTNRSPSKNGPKPRIAQKPINRRHGAGVRQRKPQVNRMRPRAGRHASQCGFNCPDCDRRPPPTFTRGLS